MRLKDIQARTDAELLASLYWISARGTKEINSPRGLTQQTHQEEKWIIQEIEKRFDVKFSDKIENM